jgi:hypothetical protein
MPANPFGTPSPKKPSGTGTPPGGTPGPLGPPPRFSPKKNNMAAVPAAPKRGGVHPIHGVFIGGNLIMNDFSCVGRYRYTSQ